MAAPPEVTINDLSGKYIMNRQLSDDIDPLLSLQGLSWFLRKAIGLATVTLSVRQYDESNPSITNTTDDTTDTTDTADTIDNASTKDATTSQGSKPTTSQTAPSTKKTHIDILQTATGGISKTQENRILDWTERTHQDRIFGKVVGRSRFFNYRRGRGGDTGFDMVGRGGGGGGGGGSGDAKDDDDATVMDEKFLTARVLRDCVTESSWDDDSEGDDDDDGDGDGDDGDSGVKKKHVQSWVRNVDDTAAGGWTAEQVWGFERLPDGKRYYTRRVVLRRPGGGGAGGEDKVQRARLVYDYIGGSG